MAKEVENIDGSFCRGPEPEHLEGGGLLLLLLLVFPPVSRAQSFSNAEQNVCNIGGV